MTPDLMEQGAARAAAYASRVATGKTESGGRAAGFRRAVEAGEVDVAHGRILYLEDGLHRAVRAALRNRTVLHARLLDLDAVTPQA